MKLNNRFIFGILSLLLAAVIAFVALPTIARQTNGKEESYVKLRTSCKLVSATTMTKPWNDAKENEPKSPTAAMSGKMPFC